ncbi:MAG TPA: helix-turn-helix domain-containing protein, partial [Clostridia bacterium]|nr:helix-turn-helix domain-containing protein [Clostridia bacterium]
GIELSRRARALYPEMKIVFISGYGDAEYLKAALQLGAVDYVFKPVNLEEVARVIQKVAAMVEAERSTRAHGAYLEALAEESLPLLRDEFLRDWTGGAFASPEAWRASADFVRLEIQGPWLPVTLQAEDARHRNLSGVMLRRLLGERLGGALSVPRQHTLSVLWPCGGEDAPALIPDLEAARQALREDYQVTLVAGVGVETADPLRVPAALQAAQDALQKRFFHQERNLLFFEEEEAPEPSACASPRLPLLQMEERLLAADRAGLLALVRTTSERFAAASGEIRHARAAMMHVVLHCAQALSALGLQAECLPTLEFFLEACALRQKEHALSEWLDEAVAQVAALDDRPHQAAVRDVCAYIRAHPGEHITLDSLAQRVHHAPTYLSALFKRETGGTVGDFLLTCRMERAMSLLRESNDTVLAIAQAVGYADAAHFTRLFKRSCGMTPQQYRKQATR